MSERRLDPFVIRADELAPAAATPRDAPPPPEIDDLPPTGEAMERVTRLAGRPRSRGLGLLGAVAGSLLSLVVSVAAYDYLLALLERYRPLGIAAIVLVCLLVLIVLAQVFRELWAFRRLGRIDSFRTEAREVHVTADRDAALALSARLSRFYAGRPDLAWGRDRLRDDAEAILDADAIIDLSERALLAPLDAAARLEIEMAARLVATTTAIVPLALLDMLAALSTNMRMIRRIAQIYGAHAGFFGSWRLLRTVVGHLMATGAIAVGDDMLGSVAGGHVLARLSRRFGEGALNGALTTRVGIAAMDVCRPLPFAALPRPKVSAITGRALAGLFQRGDTDGR